ncbi:MAG: copper resistance protein B [Pseudomonadota bacterium]|nr:copper resistance protein B [Pseudomonadota bacterium]
MGVQSGRRILLGLAATLGLTAQAVAAADADPTTQTGGAWPAPIEDDALYHRLLLDQFEYRAGDADEAALAWDVLGWVGGDHRRLWLESEGHHRTRDHQTEIGRLDVYYGRLIAPYWDLLGGVGYQRHAGMDDDPERLAAVIALHGLLPYRLEIDATARLDEQGLLTGRLEAESELLITQRLILQPRIELSAAAREDHAFDVGAGLTSATAGLRLRYEIDRQFAPYVGWSWTRKLAGTADLAREGGEAVRESTLVTGVRIWF